MLITFLILVILPLGSALVLGTGSLTRSNNERRLRIAAGLTARLEDLERRYQGIMAEWETRYRRLVLGINLDIASLRRVGQDTANIRQVFLVDRTGALLYPKAEDASLQESEFLKRSASFLSNGWLPRRPERGDWPADGGWYRWYWQDGLQWAFWVPRPEGIVGLDLNRGALLADLVGRLEGPALDHDQASYNRVRMMDEQGKVFLQWGSWNPTHVDSLARIELEGPLEGWTLSWELDPAHWPDGDSGATTALVLSLIALTAAAVFLALFFLQGFRRELREAGQRVSFVNQVSHELKTPLTNIRLYAELLAARLGPDLPKEREYAAIIEREGRRLGRLIHNVLSFGRKDKADGIQAQRGIPDLCIERCLASFAISFAERGLHTETDLHCQRERLFDPDALDQMLGNLLSNAEKYAHAGGKLMLCSQETQSGICVMLRDWGPGIPSEGIKRLFKPFERFHNELTAAVGGTGLGLYLVRDLAQRHGGDIQYEHAKPGARFTLTINAPLVDDSLEGISI